MDNQLALNGVPQPEPEKFYWDLQLQDGTVIPIPPQSVGLVNRRIQAKEPIVTTTITIPFSDIKRFSKTSRTLKGESQKLLEEASAVFNTPMIVEYDDGEKAVKARWVKKQITSLEYAKKYSHYRKLSDDDGGMVTIAFVLPVHQIDSDKHAYCTEDDIKMLTK